MRSETTWLLQSGQWDLDGMAVLASSQEPRTPNSFTSHVNKGRRSRRHSASLPGDPTSMATSRPMRQHTSDLMMMARDGRAQARDSRALVRDLGGRPSRK